MNTWKKISIITISILMTFMWSAHMGAQSITLTSPNGGEEWDVGSVQYITWNTTGITGNVRIQYSTDYGANWITVTAATENDGSYAWTVPNTVSDHCVVRVSASGGSGTAPCETRAAWIWTSSIETPEEVADILQKLEDGNINTVMVDAPRMGDNFGYCSHNKFTNFITEAKLRNFSVHAWTCNGYRTYYQTGTQGVNFEDPAEQDAQAAWIISIMAAYGDYLDGVHLDYIRYFTGSAVNMDGRMDGIKATIRKIREGLDADYPGRKITAAVYGCQPRTGGVPWEENDIPQWFLDFQAVYPNSMYGSTTAPRFMFYQQDPVYWLGQGLIDGIMPMQYTIDDALWQESLEQYITLQNFAGDPEKIYMGLGWVPRTSDRSTRGYDPPGVVRKIKYGRSRGMKGYAIFILGSQYSDVDDYLLLNALTIDSADNDFDAPFKTKVPSCLCRNCDNITYSDTSNGVFSIVSDQVPVTGITLTYPNGGEQMQVGSSQTVTWTTSGSISRVKIEFSTNNGAYWNLVESSIANTGSYTETVPDMVSSQCLVRISSAANPSINDVSDGTFSIVKNAQRSITVIYPNGGEKLKVGSSQTLLWESTGITGKVKIEFSTDNGSHWAVVESATANDGSYTNTVPSVKSSKCLVRITSNSYPSVYDVCDGVFSIKK